MYQLPEGGSGELARLTEQLLQHPLMQLIHDREANNDFLEYLEANRLFVNPVNGWVSRWVIDDYRKGWLRYDLCEWNICQTRKKIYWAMEMICSGQGVLQEALQGCSGCQG